MPLSVFKVNTRKDKTVGLDVTIEVPGVEAPVSKVNPDHLFKLDYWRSSYNGGGYNRFVDNLVGESLFSIMGDNLSDFEEYEHQVTGWADIKARAQGVRALILEAPRLGCFFQTAKNLRPQDKTLSSEADAIEAYVEMAEEQRKMLEANPDRGFFGGAFSNYLGFYDMDGLKVHAVLAGTGILGDAGVFVVYETTPETRDFYVEATEIVIETAEWVLENGDKATVFWSG